MNTPHDWPKLGGRGVDLQFSEYGHGEDGYLLIWQGQFMIAVIIEGEQDARPPDRGNTVTNHARLHAILRWLATFTAPATTAPIMVTVPAHQMSVFPQISEGWCWCQCTIETTVPGFDTPMVLSLFQAVPLEEAQRCTQNATLMIRQAQGIARAALRMEAEHQ